MLTGADMISLAQATLGGVLAALAVILPLAWKWQLGVRRVAGFVVATRLDLRRRHLTAIGSVSVLSRTLILAA